MLLPREQDSCDDARCRASQALRFAGLACAVVLATPVPGASLQWDGNGAAPPGGAGTWNLVNLRWYDGSTYRVWDNLALDDAVFDTTAGTVTLGAPVVVHNVTFTINNYTITGSTLTLGGVDPAVAVATGTATINSIIDGVAGLTKSGTGTLVLGNDNLYTGTTTIAEGTLRVGNGSTTGTLGSGDVVNDGTLAFSRSNAFDVANLISGSGNVTKAGAGVMTVTADNTYAGTTTISAGTLQLGNGGTSGRIGAGTVTLSNGAGLAIDRSDVLTIANVVAGTGGQLRQLGTGTTILTGANTYTGVTTIGAGTLQIGDGGTTGSVGAGAITNNGTLVINRSSNLSMANIISGTGTLRHDGTGTTTLSGTSTFTGAVELNGGIVQVGNLQNGGIGSNLGASDDAATNLIFDGGTLRLTGAAARSTDRNFTIADGGATLEGNGTGAGLLTWNGTASYDVVDEARSFTLGGTASGNIFAGALVDNGAGALSLTKSGAGRWVLTGSNAYTGVTTINAGTLQVGNAGTSGTLGSGDVVNNGTLTFMRSDALEVSGAISGTGAVRQTGSGTTTLTGNNTYAGTTTITAGTLQIGSGGTSGTLGTNTVSVSAGAVLAIDRSDDYTIGRVVSGAGALRQDGAGTTILTAANTYTGATTIDAGTLQIGNGGTTGALSATTVITNNGTLSIDRSNALSMTHVIGGTGVLRQAGSGTTTLTGASTFSGGVELDGGVLIASNLQNGGVASNIGASGNAAANLRFDGGTLRYTGAARSTDRNFLIEDGGATIEGSGAGVLTWTGTASYDIADEARRLTLGGTANGNLFGGALVDNGAGAVSLIKSGTSRWILGGDNTYSGTTTIAAGTLQVGNGGTTGTLGTGDVANNGTLTFSRSDAFAVGNAISGTGVVTHTGSGTTTLTGSNTYAGTTTISAGTLQIGNGGTSGTLGTGTVTNNATLAIDRGDAYIVDRVVSGTGQLRQLGAGTTILTAANTYSGATTISAGTLQLGNGGTTGSVGAGAITNNGTLSINRSSNLSMANVISGTGTLRHDGTGITTLSGTSTFTGAVELNAGVLATANLQNGSVSSSIGASDSAAANLRFDGGTLRYTGAARTTDRNFLIEEGGATLDGSGSAALTWNGTASYDIADEGRSLTLIGTRVGNIFGGSLTDNGAGALSLTKSGTGSWILTGSNTYSGDTTIAAGTLQVGAGTSGALGSGNVINNGVLTFSRSDAVTIANAISGTGNLTKAAAGTTTLTGTNTYAGATTVSAGTLQIGSGGTGGTLGTGAVSVASGANLAINRSDGYTLDQIVSGAGALRQIGSGTTTLTGANTRTGATAITAGTLQVGDGSTSGALGTGAVSITSGANLAINRSDAVTLPGVISGAGGQLRQIGTGTTILTGTNTYTGATTISAGTLQLGSGGTTGALSATTVITNNGTLAIDRSNALTMAHSISGTGALRQAGTGTTTLTGTSTFTGAVEIDGGVLAVSNLQNGSVNSNLGASGSAATNLRFDGGTLRYTGAARTTDRNFLIEDGGATLDGSGTAALTWNGTASYDITDEARSLTLTGTRAGNIFGGALTDNGMGSLSLTQAGTGSWILTGNNTHSGTTTIAAGTLQVGNNGATGTLGSGDIVNDAALVFSRTGVLEVAGAISGSGSVTKAAAGTTILAGNSAYTGTTTISAGTLQIGNGGTSGTLGSGNVANDATLTFQRSDASSIANDIAGTGMLNQSGSGTTQLSGTVAANAININAGTLQITGALTTPTLLLGSILDVQGTVSAAASAPVAITGTADANTLRIGSAGLLRATGTLGGGNDVLDIAGTLNTGAGTLDLGADDDTLILREGASIIGGVSGGSGINTLQLHIAASANLAAISSFQELGKFGTGDLTITSVVTDLTSVAVDEGTLEVTSTGGVSGVTTAAVAGGATLRVDGSFNGSAGNDAWTIAGTLAGTGTIDLAGGDDVLTLRDGAVLDAPVNGGAQTLADTLILDNATALTLGGTAITGFEQLIKSGAGIAELTGAHTYTAGTSIDAGTLAVVGSLATPSISLADATTLDVRGTVASTVVYGSAGANSIVVGGAATLNASGDLGDGDDLLDVAGTLDTGAGLFDLGDGDDTLTIHDGTRILGTVAGGGGNNTFHTAIAGTADLGAVTGFQSLIKTGAGTLNIHGPAPSGFASVAANEGTIHVAAAGNVDSVVSTTVAGGATLQVDGGYGGSVGADTFDVSGNVSGAGTIDLAGGDDVLILRDGAVLAMSVSGGSQTLADTLVIDNASAFTLGDTAVTGFERLIKSGAGVAELGGTHVYSAGTNLSAGTLVIGGSLVTPSISLADATTLEVRGTVDPTVVSGSAGINRIIVGSAATLNASGHLGAGADVLDIAGTLDTGAGTFDLGDGDDTLTIHDGTRILGTVAGGSGNNTFNAAIAGTADLGAVTGFQSLIKTGAGTLNINGPALSDFSSVAADAGTIHIAAAGSVGGVTSATVASGAMLHIDGSYRGSAGDDRLTVAGTLNGSGLIDLGDGADVLDVLGTLSLGTNPLDLGAGDDTLIVHDGSRIDGTVAGGSGSNTLNTDIASEANLGAATGFQSLVKSGAGILHINGAATTSVFDSVAVTAGTLHVAGAATVDPATTSIAAGATLQVDGNYFGTAGNDTMTVSGTVSGAGVIDLGDGDDTLTLNDGFAITGRIGGGAGSSDVIVLNNASALSFDAAVTQGFELLDKRNTGIATLVGSQSFAAVGLAAGTLIVSDSLQTAALTLGDDTLLRIGGVADAATLTGSAGSNRIIVDGGAMLQASGSLGAGADTLDVAGTLSTDGFDLGAGDDTLIIHDGTRITGGIAGGAGANTLSTDLNVGADVDAVTGFQSLLKRGAGVLNLNGPDASSFDHVGVAAGTVNVAAAGHVIDVRTTAIAQGATLNVDGTYAGSSGADSLLLLGTLSGAGTIDLGAGNDLFTLRDGAVLAARVDGGESQGQGDTIQIDNAADMTFDPQRVTGFENLLKRNAGALTLPGPASFAESVNVDAGILISTDSLTSSRIAIASGATLLASGTITGHVSNAGTLSLGGATFERLVIRGDYLGVDGLLQLRVALGDDVSASDRLAIDVGAVSGTTRVRILNQDGLGARTTGSGIQLIETGNGATTAGDAFRLDAPVLAGAYRYELFHGGAEDADPQGWYLRSLAPVRDIASLATSLVPVFHHYGVGLVGTLQDREGARLQSECDGTAEHGCQWGRVWYRSGKQNARDGSAVFDYDTASLQMGTDIHVDSRRNREDRGGLWLNIGFLGADPLRDDGFSAGEVQARAYSLGTYLTHRDTDHWYLDSSLIATYFDGLQLEPRNDARMTASAWSLAGSIEGGRRFQLGSRFSIEPQLQVIAQHIKQSDAETVGADILFEDSDTVVGRAGLSFVADIDPERWNLWLRANYWSDLDGDAQTTIRADSGAATVFAQEFDERWLEIAAGVTAKFGRRGRMHFSVSNAEGLGDSESESLQGNLGVQFQW